jgi:hypothetical protein
MTRDDIIRMAQEACKPDAPFRQYVGGVDCGMLMRDEHLERFADLVAATEREACIKACEEAAAWTEGDYAFGCKDCAVAIRARGQ